MMLDQTRVAVKLVALFIKSEWSQKYKYRKNETEQYVKMGKERGSDPGYLHFNAACRSGSQAR